LFSRDSQLAADIRASHAFRDFVEHLLDSHARSVERLWPGQATFEWALPSKISYPGEDPGEEIDYDLHFVFNDAKLDAAILVEIVCTGNELRIGSLSVEGALKDLYDFNYAPDPLTDGHRMAMIQAGHGTLDTIGNIFRTQVNLDGVLHGYDPEFGSCDGSPGTGECGDGTIDPGEACDDGNRMPGDGCDANCQREGGDPPSCEVVVGPAHPGSLRIQNLVDQEVSVSFKDFALRAIMRPYACEIYGWPEGFWEAEVQREPDGEVAEAYYSIDDGVGFSWNFDSCFTLVLRSSCVPEVEPPHICCQEVP
jgi:cysteine-rich repeat protein